MSKQISIRLSDNVIQAVDALAVADGRSRSALINRVLENALLPSPLRLKSAPEVFYGPGIGSLMEDATKPKVQSVARQAEKALAEAGVAPYVPKAEALSDVPRDPDGVRRKCMVHRKFFDLCRATACIQEHQNILERLG